MILTDTVSIPFVWCTSLSRLAVGHSPPVGLLQPMQPQIPWQSLLYVPRSPLPSLTFRQVPPRSGGTNDHPLQQFLHAAGFKKSQPNRFYTSIISLVINLSLETWLKCWRYWLAGVICFIFTGALVVFPFNKKCPKRSAFCIYIKNYTFSRCKLTLPA